jgi:hypothetical protein
LHGESVTAGGAATNRPLRADSHRSAALPAWNGGKAWLNGVVAVPIMVMMMRLTMRPAIMAQFTLPRPLQVMGWLATAAMAATVVAMVGSWLE